MAFLSSAPLDLATLAASVEAPDRGAVTSFLGRVRDHHTGRKVIRLEYSAYAPMADAECARIVSEAEARWPVRVALEHRIGKLDIGDAAVAIAAAVFFIVDDTVIGIALGAGFYAIAHKIVPTRSDRTEHTDRHHSHR